MLFITITYLTRSTVIIIRWKFRVYVLLFINIITCLLGNIYLNVAPPLHSKSFLFKWKHETYAVLFTPNIVYLMTWYRLIIVAANLLNYIRPRPRPRPIVFLVSLRVPSLQHLSQSPQPTDSLLGFLTCRKGASDQTNRHRSNRKCLRGTVHYLYLVLHIVIIIRVPWQ